MAVVVAHDLLPTSAFANGPFEAVLEARIGIANVTSSACDVRVGFSTGAGEAVARSLHILPHETRTFDGFPSDVLQTTGAGSIDFDGGDAAYRFLVAGQVYVDGPNGRFRTAVQAGDEDGTLLSFDMSPWGRRQVGVDVGGPDGTTVISSTRRAVCFGVVVDNVSNDGTFPLAVPD